MRQQQRNSLAKFAVSHPPPRQDEGNHQLPCVAALLDTKLPDSPAGTLAQTPPLESYGREELYIESYGAGRDEAVKTTED